MFSMTPYNVCRSHLLYMCYELCHVCYLWVQSTPGVMRHVVDGTVFGIYART